METPGSSSEPFEVQDRVVWKIYTKQRKNIGVFNLLLSVKLDDWSLLSSLSLLEGRGLSYYPMRTFIGLFFLLYYNASLLSRCPFSGDSASAWFQLWIPPVLERVEAQIFLFLTVLLSVNSDWAFMVLVTTLFMVSEISGLGTGTWLKSLAHHTEVHF